MKKRMLLASALLFSCAYPVGETPPPSTVRRFSVDKIRSTVQRQNFVIRNEPVIASTPDISLSVLHFQIQQFKKTHFSKLIDEKNIKKLLQE